MKTNNLTCKLCLLSQVNILSSTTKYNCIFEAELRCEKTTLVVNECCMKYDLCVLIKKTVSI